MKCPNCRREIIIDKKDLKLHKHGRSADCPECGKGIILFRSYKGPKEKRERQSKKDRLRERRAEK